MNGSIDLQYQLGMDTSGLRSDGLSTDRYLDPTVEQNYTNQGSGAGVAGSWERNWGSSDRSRIEVRHDRVGFMVPNESLHQDAGQLQDRTSDETSGQISFTHVFSPSVLLDLRGSGRDVAATLWSNVLSTPIEPFQNRSFREGYGSAAVSVHHGIHDFKLNLALPTAARIASRRHTFRTRSAP